MIHVSAQWTDTECREVITALVDHLNPPDDSVKLFDTEKVKDVGERIRLIATKPPSFLEANRDAILKGL
jgi:hypothetical protein